jgi:hypothetical protein
MTAWQPIETAPRDGSWFLICIAGEDGSYEVGCFDSDPLTWDTFVPVDDGLFRKETTVLIQWRGFNNMHAATHWAPLPEMPS